jgi:Cation transport ATPase
VGIYQDYHAERAIEALKSLQSGEALVLREGQWVRIPAKMIVPGDIIQV